MDACRNFIVTAIILLHIGAYADADAQKKNKPNAEGQYSIEQAISEMAQLHTMAFSGLAFITGNYGADTFFPPGKVADFFGFQYMRDMDKNKMGHNTDFLTRIANNVIHILNKEQLQLLISLADKQAPIYDEFANKRLVLIKAFRTGMESNKRLNKEEVIRYCSLLYGLDAELSYNRALVVGKIISSFTEEQKASLSRLEFGNSATWPVLPENLDKRSMSHRAHVAVMTYASELFSWYAGSVKADVYFCPERHGTYFGGFFLKDYRAMGNPGYNISTALTGDKGEQFIEMLTPQQSECLYSTIQNHKLLMHKIVELREAIVKELRKAIANETPDKEMVVSLITQYGALDGELSCDYANCFSTIYHSLTGKQREDLKQLRGLDVYPKGAYLFSDPIEIPENLDCSSLVRMTE